MYEVVGCAGVSVCIGCHYLHLRDKAEPVKARPVLGGWLAARSIWNTVVAVVWLRRGILDRAASPLGWLALGELPGRGGLGWPARRGAAALLNWCLARALRFLALLLLAFTASVVAEVDEGHFVSHDFDFGFLLAGGLVFPSFLFETAFNVEAETFGEELTAVLGGLAEYGYVDEVTFLVLLVLIVIPDSIEC